jgi:uncharacterized protein YprB with RNaseH-like and TPR domain
MRLDTQTGLRLLEEAKSGLVTFDIESTGLKADYGTPICVSFKPYGKKPFTLSVKELGNDKAMLKETAKILSSYECWMTYYGSLFDIKMLNTRMLKHGLDPLPKRLHIDLYFKLKNHLLLNGKSLGNVGRFLKCGEEKMSVHQDVWAEMGFQMKKHLPVMIERCESDTILLENVYDKTKHLIGGVDRWK